MGDIDDGYTAGGRSGNYTDAYGRRYQRSASKGGWTPEDQFRSSQSATDAQIAAWMDVMQEEGRFKNKDLDQKWKIAQLNESGANSRASMSAAASRYAADRSASSARYSADKSFEGVKYRTDADERMEGGKLGLGYLTTAANLRGPADYLQAADFMRGASARQDVPIFMQNLMRGVNGAGYQMPGGAPAGATIQGLMAKMTGDGSGAGGGVGSGPTGQDATFLQSARELARRGFHSLAPGALERLSPTELGVLRSAVEYSGDGGQAFSWDDVVKQYGNSRIGQGAANLA